MLQILKNNNGYIILETVISMAVFALVLFSATSMLVFASNASFRIHVHYELSENARIAMEFLTMQIKEAQGIELQTSENDTLDMLWLHRNLGTANEHITTFRYINEPERNWLMFGGRQPNANFDTTQELARYIANIKMILDEERRLLHISITTDTTIQNTSVELLEPIVLNRTVDLRHKLIK